METNVNVTVVRVLVKFGGASECGLNLMIIELGQFLSALFSKSDHRMRSGHKWHVMCSPDHDLRQVFRFSDDLILTTGAILVLRRKQHKVRNSGDRRLSLTPTGAMPFRYRCICGCE